MHNRLLMKEMCLDVSFDLFKLWEITDNTSKVVQDRNIVSVED